MDAGIQDMNTRYLAFEGTIDVQKKVHITKENEYN